MNKILRDLLKNRYNIRKTDFRDNDENNIMNLTLD